MKTIQQLSTLFVLAIIMLACGDTSKTDASGAVEAPKKNIHEATFFGDLSAVNQHIKYGTDLNQKDDFGSTALNTAITFNKIEIAKALISGGADLSVSTSDGSTPLHAAALFGRVEIVKLLIAKGAALEPVNNYNATPYTNASTPFDQMKMVYDQLSRDLGPFGFKLDYEALEKNRVTVTAVFDEALQNQTK